jgi:hypothetical protein
LARIEWHAAGLVPRAPNRGEVEAMNANLQQRPGSDAEDHDRAIWRSDKPRPASPSFQ